MNVKKIKLRNEIFDFLNTNPSSEVKDIAAHVGVTKQALYYHIKILTKENKIAVTDSTVVNGIEKKFYSIVLSDKAVEKNDASFDVKTDINEDKTNSVDKNERSNFVESDKGNLIPVAKESSNKKGDENKNLDLIEDQTSTKPDIITVSDQANSKESLPVNANSEHKSSKTNESVSKKKPKKSFLAIHLKKHQIQRY